MRTTIRGRGFVLLAAIAVAFTVTTASTTPVQARHKPPIDPTTDHVVHVGGGDHYPSGAGPFNFTRFYPEVLRVHRGDRVQFRVPPAWVGALHTVHFRPIDMDALQHPVAAPVPDALRHDPETGHIALNEELMLGSPTYDGCGLKDGSPQSARPKQPPCSLHSTERGVGSEFSESFWQLADPSDFWIDVNLPVGTYRYQCNYHEGMVGVIEVVADDVALPDRATIEAGVKSDIAADLTSARALKAELDRVRFEQDGDDRVYQVTAGGTTSDGHVTIIGFSPSDLVLAPGDRVRFTTAGNEPQSVTFPVEAAGRFWLEDCRSVDDCYSRIHPSGNPIAAPVGLAITGYPFVCEYDDPLSGKPGVPTFMVRATGCAPAPGTRPQLEWLLSPLVLEPHPAPRDEILTRGTFHDSGNMVDYDFPSFGRFPDGSLPLETFDATFPVAGSFPYGCQIHPQVMTGNIRVVE